MKEPGPKEKELRRVRELQAATDRLPHEKNAPASAKPDLEAIRQKVSTIVPKQRKPKKEKEGK